MHDSQFINYVTQWYKTLTTKDSKAFNFAQSMLNVSSSPEEAAERTKHDIVSNAAKSGFIDNILGPLPSIKDIYTTKIPFLKINAVNESAYYSIGWQMYGIISIAKIFNVDNFNTTKAHTLCIGCLEKDLLEQSLSIHNLDISDYFYPPEVYVTICNLIGNYLNNYYSMSKIKNMAKYIPLHGGIAGAIDNKKSSEKACTAALNVFKKFNK